MRTAKCMTSLLIAVLAGAVPATLRAEQGSAAQPAKEPSNTRTMDCLVRITADPDVMSLNISTVEGLLYSSAVLGRTVKEMDILGPDAQQNPHALVSIQWLSENRRSAGMGTSKTSDDPGERPEVMRQYQDVYGERYREMMGLAERIPNEKSDAGVDAAAGGRNTPKDQAGPNGARPDGVYGGVGGGMGGGYGGSMSGGMTGGGTGRTMSGYGGRGGGMGMGAPYGMPAHPEAGQIVEQSVTIRLLVRLPETAKPVAGEFLDALVEGLRRSLAKAHVRYVENLNEVLASTRFQRDKVQEELRRNATEPSADGVSVKKQLDTIVDLSVLTAQMPFQEALNVLKDSVAPPLQIVAMWNDLMDSARVEASTPINIDGMPAVRLGTALDLLLKGVPKPSDPPLVYQIRDNVVVIGTSAMLGTANTPAAEAKRQVDVTALADQRNELARAIRILELDLVSMDARRKAMSLQIEEARQQADRQLTQDTVTQELEKLVAISTANVENLQKMVATGRVAQADVAPAQESAARARIELARRREELTRLTSGGRIEQYTGQLSAMAIDEAEKRARLEVLHTQSDGVQKQLAQVSAFDPEAAGVRAAQESLDVLSRRIGAIQARLATLQPPTVVVIGAN